MPHEHSWIQYLETRQKGFFMDDVTVKYKCTECDEREARAYLVFEAKVALTIAILSMITVLGFFLYAYIKLLESVR